MEAVLAQGKSITAMLSLLGGLIVVVIGLGIVILLLRRRLLVKEAAAGQEGLLSDLKRMRDRGEISIEEYDTARKSMAARLAGKAPPPRPAPSPPVRVAEPGFDLTGAPLPRAAVNPPDKPGPAS